MEKIRFAVEISNSSVEKLWELLLGDGFFEFLPSFKKRIDTEDGFTIVLKHHKFSVTFDDLVPYSVVSGKVSSYPYHIEFRFTITPREHRICGVYRLAYGICRESASVQEGVCRQIRRICREAFVAALKI